MSERPVIWTGTVQPEWIDHNGHMNAGYYLVVFDEATGPWSAYCGIDADYRRRHACSTFSVEAHLLWERELHEGDPIRVEAQLLSYDDKKFHTFMQLRHRQEGYVAASHELLTMHIDMRTRRAAPFLEGALERLSEVLEEHAGLGRPKKAGRIIRTKGTVRLEP